MFKFDFDIETCESRTPTGDNEHSDHVADTAGANSSKEPFREVLFREASSRPDSEGQPPSLSETVGVRHISSPIISEDDHVFQQTEQLHSDLIPQV